FRQRLAYHQVEVGIHLIKRLAISIEAGNGRAARPLVAGVKLRAKTRQFGRDACAERMPRNRLQQVTQHAVRVIPRGKRVRHRIKRRKFGVAFQFLSKRHTGAPIARGATVIGKSVREVILEVIGSRQSLSTEAVNGCVSVVLVETGKLDRKSTRLNSSHDQISYA